MKALVIHTLADDFAGCALRDIPVPQPGPGEVRVRVRAASVNFPDLLMTRGAYQFKPTLPFTPGLDLAGEIDAVGDGVDSCRIGDAVMGGTRLGAMAEYCVLAANAVSAKPACFTWSQAAAFGTAYLTAWVALVRRGRLAAGERLLVTGAAGGVGLAAVDLGKALGATVIAGSASKAKLAIVARDYAPQATVVLTPGFREQVKSLTDGDGVDAVFDPVGGAVFEECLRCIAPEARMLVVGFAAGRPGLARTELLLIKRATIMGIRAGEHGRAHPADGAADRDALDRMAAQGRLRPRVHAALPLARWREALTLLASREVIGKAVLTP